MAYLWSLFLFALVLFGPVPLCLVLMGHWHKPYAVSAAKLALELLTLWSLMQIILGLCLGSISQFKAGPVFTIEAGLIILGLALLQTSQAIAEKLRQQIESLSKLRLQLVEIWVLATIAFVGLVLLERIITQPFTDYDTLWFHGPIIARWYQTGSLSQLDPLGSWIIEHPDAHHYPYNWHILSIFFLLPFQQDILAALPMLIAWLVLGLSIYLLSHSLGAERFYALSATALVLFAPFLLNHVTTLHIDLPLAAMGIASLYYLVTYQKTRSSIDAALFWVTTGLTAGIKTPGIVYAGVLILAFGAIELSALVRYRRISIATLPIFWLGLLGFGFLGGFWYIKYAMEAGSTLAYAASPKDLEAGVAFSQSQVVFAPSKWFSELKDLWQQADHLLGTSLIAQFEVANPAHWSMLMAQAVVRFQLPLGALIVQAMLMPYAWLKSARKHRQRSLLGISILFLITFLLYWMTPYSAAGLTPLVGFNMRYGFPAWAVLGVVAAISASTVQFHKPRMVAVVLISGVLGVFSSTLFDLIRAQSLIGQQSFWPSQLINTLIQHPLKGIQTFFTLLANTDSLSLVLYLIAAIAMSGILRTLLVTSWGKAIRAGIGKSWRKPAAIATCTAFILATSIHLQDMRDRNRLYIYQGIDQAIETFTQPGDRIAYFESDRSYLFYGKHLNRSVIHLPPDTENIPSWIKTLQQAEVTLVAVGPTRNKGKRFRALTEQANLQAHLTPIFGDNPQKNPVFYRLKS